MSDNIPAYSTPGFWQRPFAMMIDMIIIALIGQVFIIVFQPYLIAHIWISHCLGLAVAIAYFAIADSRITNGMSPGKRILRIRILDEKGNQLSVFKAAMRAILPISPILLEGIPLHPDQLLSWIGGVVSIMLYGLALAQIIIYIVDRPSRLMLQDRLVNTVVTREHEGVPPIYPMGNIKKLVVLFLLIMTAAWPWVLKAEQEKRPVSEFRALKTELLKRSDVISVSIRQGVVGRDEKGYRLSVRLWLTHGPELSVDEINTFTDIILINYPKVRTLDGIHLQIKTGIDMGIVTSYIHKTYLYTP